MAQTINVEHISIKNISKEFQRVSVGNEQLLSAIRMATEKFNVDLETSKPEVMHMLQFSTDEQRHAIQDELQNVRNDNENFLDKNQLQEEKLQMSKIVLLSRVGNNKSYIWKPAKVDFSKKAIAVLKERVGTLDKP